MLSIEAFTGCKGISGRLRDRNSFPFRTSHNGGEFETDTDDRNQMEKFRDLTIFSSSSHNSRINSFGYR